MAKKHNDLTPDKVKEELDDLNKSKKKIIPDYVKMGLTKDQMILNDTFILQLMVGVDLLESTLLEYSEFLKQIGHFKYDRKFKINGILKTCKELIKENDHDITFEEAAKFGELLDSVKEYVEKMFAECVIFKPEEDEKE